MLGAKQSGLYLFCVEPTFHYSFRVRLLAILDHFRGTEMLWLCADTVLKSISNPNPGVASIHEGWCSREFQVKSQPELGWIRRQNKRRRLTGACLPLVTIAHQTETLHSGNHRCKNHTATTFIQIHRIERGFHLSNSTKIICEVIASFSVHLRDLIATLNNCFISRPKLTSCCYSKNRDPRIFVQLGPGPQSAAHTLSQESESPWHAWH